MGFFWVLFDFGVENRGLFVFVGVSFDGFEYLLAKVDGVALLCEENVTFAVGDHEKWHSLLVGFCFPDKIFHICSINESVCALQSIFINAPNHRSGKIAEL